MLTELCAEIRNYFLRDYRKDIHAGSFVVSDGSIEPLPFLQNGQYYRIVGSVFNDGVWKYGESNPSMEDEVFHGAVWAMAVPPAVIALSQEIDDWVTANADALNSPYISETVGSYSRTRASFSSTDGVRGYGWKEQFADKLSLWRRISVL